MFADHAQVLYELRIKFPVTHEDDLVILMKNHETYHKWLETYSVEGWAISCAISCMSTVAPIRLLSVLVG